MANNIELHNPATEGVAGLKGIRLSDEERKKLPRIQSGQAAFKQTQDYLIKNTPTSYDAGFVGLNDSRLDKNISSLTDLQDLNEFRAQEQSDLGQAVNGIVKGVGLTGTTFLDGTVGAAVGLISGISALLDDDDSTKFWQSLWNNEFSQLMNSANKSMEDIFKNYYSKDEMENPLVARNIFSGNFIGDKFIKNLGFTIGAYYSGKAFNSLLSAARIPALIRTATHSSVAPKMVMSGAGATVSAFNEGRIMALEDSNNWRIAQEEEAKARYEERLKTIESFKGESSYELLRNRAFEDYNATLAKIQEDQGRMGNLEMFLNIPLLTASNLFEFGKLYANGFKTSRKLSRLKASPIRAGAKAIGSGLAEGIEEVSQGAISNISGLGYEQNVLNFYEARLDPMAEGQTINWMKAISKGLNDTFNDSATAEEFLIGSLTGLLGMPVFGKSNTSQAWLGKDKAIGLAGGVGGAITDYNEEKARIDKIVNYVNERVANDAEFRNYYQGLIRHAKLQNDMDKAAILGDAKDFKNAEFDQLLSDVIMFDNAGKLEDFLALLDGAFETSDENLNTIIENTTTTLEDGTKAGPFIDANGNKLTATPEGKQQMIDKLTKSKDEIVNTINNYIKVKDTLDWDTQESLSDDELETLTSLKMKIQNWRERVTEMHPEIQHNLKTIARDFGNYRKNTRTNLETERQFRELEKSLQEISQLSPDMLALNLITNPKLLDSLNNVIEPLVSKGHSSMTIDSFKDMMQQLKDSKDLWTAAQQYSSKFNEYISNIELLREDLTKTYDKLAERYEDIQDNKTVENILTNTKDLKSFKESIATLSKEKFLQLFPKILEKATDEQKQIFQDYDDLDSIEIAVGEFDIGTYDSNVATIIAQNLPNLLENATSKEDFFNGLNTLKEALSKDTTIDNSQAVQAIDDLINHVNARLKEIEKEATGPSDITVTGTGGGLLGDMEPTSQVANQDGSLPSESNPSMPPPGVIPVQGDTREETLQNAIDKILDYVINDSIELLQSVATSGMYNPNLTAEDINTIKNIAIESLKEVIIAEADDKSKEAADKEIAKNNDKKGNSLNNSLITNYHISDAKNKKKSDYIPTDGTLLKIQNFLKEYGTYNLLESGKIGLLDFRTKGIDINFITNDSFTNTIFLATEVTSDFKKYVKNVNYTPIVIDGKEYAVLGTLKNNSSKQYSEIVNQVGLETSGQITEWKIAETKTKIKHFYSGRMVTSDANNSSEERSLSSVLTGKTFGEDYGFVIVYSNESKYIGVDPAIDNISDLNTYLPRDKRTGSLWLMSRGSNGVLYPHYVSIARTGEVNWGNSPFFDNIRKHLKIITQNNSLEKKLQSKIALNKSIFFPTGNKLSFADDFVSIGGTKIKRVDYVNETEYLDAIINLIKSKNLRFQVSAKSLNETTTRDEIIKEGIVKTDLLQLEHIIGSFDIYGIYETPEIASREHTGSREVKLGNKTNTFYLYNIQYDEFVNEEGVIQYKSRKGELVENESLYNKLRVISLVSSGNITGVEVGNSTLYKVVHEGVTYYLEKVKQQPLHFIRAQQHGNKIKNKTQQTNLPPIGGLLGKMEQNGVTAPTEEELKGEVDQSETTPLPPPSNTTIPSQEGPKSDFDILFGAMGAPFEIEENIDTWIQDMQPDIMQIAIDAGYAGVLNSDVIKGLFTKNGIPIETVTKNDLLSKIEFVLNCKQP